MFCFTLFRKQPKTYMSRKRKRKCCFWAKELEKCVQVWIFTFKFCLATSRGLCDVLAKHLECQNARWGFG